MNMALKTKLTALGVNRVFVVDAETFYSKEYSLTVLPMQEYILDPRFEVIGWGVSENFKHPVWLPGNYGIQHLMQQELDRPGTLVVAHNAFFDGGVLEYRMGVKPWMYLCTMMGARPTLIHKTDNARMSLANLAQLTNVGPKMGYVAKAKGKRYHKFTTQELSDYGDYCIRDVEVCTELAKSILSMLPADELRLLDLTIRKFTRPQVALSSSHLEAELTRVRSLKRQVLIDAGITDAAELRSNNKFAGLLERYGVTPPMKVSPATRYTTWAFAKTDPEFKALKDHPDEKVQALVAARLQHKSTQAETRAERFLGLSKFKRFGIPLLYCGAHTSRFSGYDKLNLQNLPRGGLLRRSVTAPPGHVMVAVDLSQIEVRVAAVIANQRNLIDIFKEGRDPYKSFATQVYHGVSYDNVTHGQRRICKSAVLGLQYSMGVNAFIEYAAANGIELSGAAARRLVGTYRDVYSKIAQMWEVAGKHWIPILAGRGTHTCLRVGPLFIAKGFIGLPNGMSIKYRDISHAPDGTVEYGPPKARKYIYGGKTIENTIQALARILMTDAELWLAKRGVRAAFSVHDELLFVCRKEMALKLVRALDFATTRSTPWMKDMPVECEVKLGSSYGNLEEDRYKWNSLI